MHVFLGVGTDDHKTSGIFFSAYRRQYVLHPLFEYGSSEIDVNGDAFWRMEFDIHSCYCWSCYDEHGKGWVILYVFLICCCGSGILRLIALV